MGVYIKGMEMPKNCDDCYVDIDCPYDESQDGYKMMGGRPRKCPLAPVPPHGDLIDRDVLKENCMKEDSFLAELLFRKVSNAPTIIPAEEGE